MPAVRIDASTHRASAVECNNEAWTLAELPSRTPEQVDRMIHLAHASCVHWCACGGALERMRAHTLLAYANQIAGETAAADHWCRAAGADLASATAAAAPSAFDQALLAATAASIAARLGRVAEAIAQSQHSARSAASLVPEERTKLAELVVGLRPGQHA